MRVTLAYLLLHLLAACAVGRVAWQLVKDRPWFWHRLLIPAGAMIFLTNAVILNFRPDWVTAMLPVADAMFLGNVQLEALAIMLCGALGSTQRLAAKLRVVAVVAAALVALRYANAYHFAPRVQVGEPTVIDDTFVIQSTDETCSAAGTATMLRLLGVDASEVEMARLCLTRRNLGTSPLGIYRGLKMKVAGHDWDVHIFLCPLAELAEMPKPCLIALRFRPDRRQGERLVGYAERRLSQAEGHSVVYLGRDPETHKHQVADPASGPRLLEHEELDSVFAGMVHVIAGADLPQSRPAVRLTIPSRPASRP